MANGRTFRPGPRVEYRQKPLRFNDDTLSTAEIASPLDVADGPGGTLWRQGRGHRRTRPVIQTIRHIPALLPLDPFSGQAAWTEDDDTCVAAGTFYDPIVTDGGARGRRQSTVYRRPRARTPYFVRQHLDLSEYGQAAWTEDDDTCAATGTHTDPAYGDGTIRARAGRAALRRVIHRAPFYQRHPAAIFTTDNQAAANWTEDDDTCAASGTHTDPPYGDGLIRQRAQSSRYQRPRARNQYCQLRRRLPFGTGELAWTEDDDACSAAGTHYDPAPFYGPLDRPQTAAHRRVRHRNQYCQPRGREIPEPPVGPVYGDPTLLRVIHIQPDNRTITIARDRRTIRIMPDPRTVETTP